MYRSYHQGGKNRRAVAVPSNKPEDGIVQSIKFTQINVWLVHDKYAPTKNVKLRIPYKLQWRIIMATASALQ
jgi:hypothetical protein